METERLFFRRWRMEDAESLFSYAKNPNIGPNAGWKPHQSIEESREILELFVQRDEWALVDKHTNKIIGSVGVFRDEKRTCSDAWRIGYVLSEEYWGKGVMTEAVKRVIQYIFEDLNASIISISHFPFNQRSRRVIEKCGFKFEGVLRRSFQIYDGSCQDEWMYSILEEEY